MAVFERGVGLDGGAREELVGVDMRSGGGRLQTDVGEVRHWLRRRNEVERSRDS